MSPVKPRVEQAVEQLVYARLLDWGTRLGLVVLVPTFAAYMLGLTRPHVPLERLPSLWSLPVASYLQQTGSPTGWGWLVLAWHGDMSGFVGIAILAGCSLPCLLAVLPIYRRRGDKAFVALCLAEVAVLLLAASGWFVGGH
jgi:hypothetical protein